MYQTKTAMKWMGALALAMTSGAVYAQALPTGAWRGAMSSNGRLSAIDVVFKDGKADVHFDAPFNCRLGARFVQKKAQVAVYRFGVSVAGGSFCDKLSGTGILEISTSADKELHLNIVDPSKADRHWQADLTPAAP